jgi:hypothetical protein
MQMGKRKCSPLLERYFKTFALRRMVQMMFVLSSTLRSSNWETRNLLLAGSFNMTNAEGV